MKNQLRQSILILTFAIIGWSNNVNAQTIAAGNSHSLFLCTGSPPYSVGENLFGELGIGVAFSHRLTPVQVNGVSGITSVAAGYYTSLFLKNDGTVWSVGMNNYGQLGDGTTSDKSTPVQVIGVSGITAVSTNGTPGSTSNGHSLFLKNDGTVWGVGNNWEGQLGDGTLINKSIAGQVSGLNGITAVAAGRDRYSLFLKNDGTVWAVGRNYYGQLGDGTTGNKKNAVQLSSLSGITAISAGHTHSLFLKNDGTVWAVGYNGRGQLGDGTTTDKKTPVQVNGVSGVVAVAAGTFHSLFLKNDGTVWSVGNNSGGELGDGTTIDKKTPVQVSGVSGVTAVSGGGYFSLFLKNDSTVWAVGIGGNGQLGNGTQTNKTTAVQVIGLCGATGIEDNSTANNISIFPNPANEQLFIELTDYKNTIAEIFNIQGQLLQSIPLKSDKTTIQINELISGLYLVKVKSSEGMIVKKLVKN